MSHQSLRSIVGSGIAVLPWCCIAPAAIAFTGVAAAGIGTALGSAIPVFLVLSVGLLGRSLYLALVMRQGPKWVRVMVLLSTGAIALAWAFRFGWVAL